MTRHLLTTLTLLSLLGTFCPEAGAAGPRGRVLPNEAHETTVRSKPAPAIAGPHLKPGKKTPTRATAPDSEVVAKPAPGLFGPPNALQMKRAASRRIDLRALPQTLPRHAERPEREEPASHPVTIEATVAPPERSQPQAPLVTAPAPAPLRNFDGLDYAGYGDGHPPDTNGDVGPAYYLQSINTSLGIFRKSDGARLAALSFNTFMSQGNFGNVCDTDNFGDPVVLYDSFEDRWVVTDFAFKLDTSGNVVNPPGAYQCFAVSMSGDPLSGGWNYYSIETTGGLGDYPKLGIWPDGLYMSVNMFEYPATGAYLGPRVYALNKAQMYAGNPAIQVVTFDAPSADFTLLPSNARLQAGTPATGTPNYFLSTWQFTNALTIYKFHVDWSNVGSSTFTGPDVPIAASSWPNAGVPNAPSLGGNSLDVLQIRAMMQNQYSKLGGVESLWSTHTVRRAAGGFAAPRWYQVDVTGGTVGASIPQAATLDPDGANLAHRFIPSLAVDRAGNMAVGYSTSSSTTKPALKYAGRLAGDPVNTISQTEQLLVQGAGTQSGSCGGPCQRWGDYSAMSLDPDGCTFWFTSMYYAADGLNYQTRIGSFAFPSCTPVGVGGTLQGTVTGNPGGVPLGGATVQLGARTAVTNGAGAYSFTHLPAGTYPGTSAMATGYNTIAGPPVAISDNGTTTRNFALAAAPSSGCPTDTTSADFAAGTATDVDLTGSPGDVVLAGTPLADQQNATVGANGVTLTSAVWGGQTFTPAIAGRLARVDLNLFCSGCTGTTPGLTLSLRATSGGLPTGADLSTATIAGFSSGAATTYSATFIQPATLTAGTTYALIIRPTADPSAGSYALTRSGDAGTGADVYAGGDRLSGASNGTAWSIPTTGGVVSDAGFKTTMVNAYVLSGSLVSSAKDSNPAAGLSPAWSTLSWTAATPANTTVRLQVAGSNAAGGPFNFVGPDGTAATFFTTAGASLAPFYGLRYLRYTAYLDTADPAVTPALSDVTACYAVLDCSAPVSITPSAVQVCPSSTGNTASGPAGATSYAWSITNGSITGGGSSQSVTYTAGVSGNVGLTLNIIEAGGCHRSGSTNVPIGSPPAPTINAGGPATFCSGGSVTLTSSSTTGNQWYLAGNPIGGATGQQHVATAPGDYTVVATAAGSCATAPSAPVTVTVISSATVPVISAGGPTTFCAGGSVTLTSSIAAGNQWSLDGNAIPGATGQQVVASATGRYTVQVMMPGCSSAVSAPLDVTVTTPPTPTITAGGPTSFCPGGSVTLTSSSAAGNQWSLGGTPIAAATQQSYVATAAGSYSVVTTDGNGCSSAASAATIVTVNANPPTAILLTAITPLGQRFETICAGQSIVIRSTAPAMTLQWYRDGVPIPGASAQNYTASVAGGYTLMITNSNGCSTLSGTFTIIVTPLPATPSIAAGGSTTFCAGGSVTLTSSSAGGNQWLLNGVPIAGANSQTYLATVAGDYSVIATANGCSSPAAAATTVTINPNPIATISAASPMTSASSGTASVAGAGAGATYAWTITGGTINSGNGTATVSFTAGAGGTLTLGVTVTTAAGCVSARMANVNVVALPTVTVAQVTPAAGTIAGNSPVMITGSGFLPGAAVTFGGMAATLVVVVSDTTITARTPAHAAGAANVVVTNANTASGTRASAYLYLLRQFDPNGDGVIDPADVFYLVNYLFLQGPPPSGIAGLLPSGDANRDAVIDPADIFYVLSYLFTGGAAPASAPGTVATTAMTTPPHIAGSVTLGAAVLRNGRYVIPVIVTVAPGTAEPQALALSLRFGGGNAVTSASIHRAGAGASLQPAFEISRRTEGGVAYLLAFDPHAAMLGTGSSAVVAELELDLTAESALTIELDPALTMLSDAGGMAKATVGNHALQLRGTTIRPDHPPTVPTNPRVGRTDPATAQ